MIKPSLPKGTRDFSPAVVRKRNYILHAIRSIFELYGFQPLETPAMENLTTLMGKYGEEGDKLIFKILDNGEILGHAQQAKDSRELAMLLCEKALRYDLTIPFARYVVMNQHEVIFPFKRYQIQPVWRADRPQKGRYREFYQCDADIAGSNSLLNEAELLLIYDKVFSRLKLNDCHLHINNRKILKGIMQACSLEEKEKNMLIIIDKKDKIGLSAVQEELAKENIPAKKSEQLLSAYSFEGNNDDTISFLKNFLQQSPVGLEGIREIELVLNYLAQAEINLQSSIKIDITLARGLEYYTGIIIEAKAPPGVKMGSIGGGGRYDDLTGLFGLPDISGVGISFGVDRIYDVMEELQLFPETTTQSTQLLFLNLGMPYQQAAFQIMQQLRENNIAAEIFHEPAKMDKQLKYADRRGIPFVAIIGENEIQENMISIKNLGSGQQQKISREELLSGKWLR